MHSLFFKIFPVDVLPRKVLPRSGEAALFEEALRKALMCLTGKTKVSEAVQEWMKANVSEKSPEDLQSFNRAMEVQKKWEASGQEAGSSSIETTGETAEEVHAETPGAVNSNCLS